MAIFGENIDVLFEKIGWKDKIKIPSNWNKLQNLIPFSLQFNIIHFYIVLSRKFFTSFLDVYRDLRNIYIFGFSFIPNINPP